MNGTLCSGSFCSNPITSSAVNSTNHSLTNGTMAGHVNLVDYGSFFEASYYASIYMSIISVLTILTNGLLLVVFMKDPLKTFRTPTAYFLVGIALADLATAAVVEPCLYYCFFRLYLDPGHAPTRVTCSTMLEVGRVASTVTINVSYFTVLAFTLVQYLAIAAPMKMARHITAKSVLILQVLIWLYALAFQIGIAMAAEVLVAMKVDMYLHNLLSTVLILISYALLFRTFRRKMAYSVRLQSESSRQTKESQTRRVHIERKFLLINLFLILVLIFTNIPNVVWWFIHVNGLVPYSSPSSLTVQLVIDCILFTKFLLDPFAYAWRLAKYRTALRKVCCCGCDGCLLVSAETRQRSDLPLALDEQGKSTVTLSSLHITAN